MQPSTIRQGPRERILIHVSDRFLQDGFARVSVDQIAADLIMSKKTFYKVFPSKEHLVEQVIESLLDQIRSHLSRIQESEATFIVKFHQVMTFLGQVGSRIGKPFLQDLQQQTPQLWARIETFRRDRITQVFSRLLDQGVREGYVRRNISKHMFLRCYLAAVEAVVNPTVLMHESFSAQEAIQSILEMFFHGVLTNTGSKTLLRLQRRETLYHPKDR